MTLRGAIVLLLMALLGVPASAQQHLPPLVAGDRLLIVAPHPDDEVLGAGGLIQQARAAGADVHVVYLTNGDHNQVAFKLYKLLLHLRPRQYLAFGRMRQREAVAAMTILGLSRDHLTFLGYPDYGTLQIWRDYWGDRPPFRSDATQSNAVPYKDALDFGQPYKPENVVADLAELFRRFSPTKIFVTHPADTNPDHRAAANFVRLALLQYGAQSPPQLYYYVIHFGHWPRPYHYHPELQLAPPRQLLDDGDWFSLPLTPEQTKSKYEAILQHRTQLTTRQYFLVAFARTNENFATIDVPAIPTVPTGVIDWRRAIRTKVLEVTASESTSSPKTQTETDRAEGEDALVDETKPVSLTLAETAFVRQGDDLVAQVTLRNRLGKRANVHLFLYPYNRNEDFAKLPKLHVNITPFGNVHVFDYSKRIQSGSVTVISVGNRLIVRVPLALLGKPAPDFLFTATRANLREVAADDTAWHLFALSNPAGNRHNSGG